MKIKRHTDESVWIRIAWGDGFSQPNHLKPTYVVHQLQSPYVFVSSLSSKVKPLLLQVRKSGDFSFSKYAMGLFGVFYFSKGVVVCVAGLDSFHSTPGD